MNRIIILLLTFIPYYCMAMNISDFKQPYPAGSAMEGNPNFIGTAWLYPLSHEKELNVPMFNVTFEPGCRNNWHRRLRLNFLTPSKSHPKQSTVSSVMRLSAL